MGKAAVEGHMAVSGVGDSAVQSQVVEHLNERIRILQDKVVQQYNRNLSECYDCHIHGGGP